MSQNAQILGLEMSKCRLEMHDNDAVKSFEYPAVGAIDYNTLKLLELIISGKKPVFEQPPIVKGSDEDEEQYPLVLESEEAQEVQEVQEEEVQEVQKPKPAKRVVLGFKNKDAKPVKPAEPEQEEPVSSPAKRPLLCQENKKPVRVAAAKSRTVNKQCGEPYIISEEEEDASSWD